MAYVADICSFREGAYHDEIYSPRLMTFLDKNFALYMWKMSRDGGSTVSFFLDNFGAIYNHSQETNKGHMCERSLLCSQRTIIKSADAYYFIVTPAETHNSFGSQVDLHVFFFKRLIMITCGGGCSWYTSAWHLYSLYFSCGDRDSLGHQKPSSNPPSPHDRSSLEAVTVPHFVLMLKLCLETAAAAAIQVPHNGSTERNSHRRCSKSCRCCFWQKRIPRLS